MEGGTQQDVEKKVRKVASRDGQKKVTGEKTMIGFGISIGLVIGVFLAFGILWLITVINERT